jgi:peptidoglycan L-alanyl-D-glutamate endopeptidase CwlK
LCPCICFGYSFSKKSIELLELSDNDIQVLLNEVIEIYDVRVLETYRDKKRQNQLLKKGFTELPFPESKHNTLPSKAIDLAPWHRELPHIRFYDTNSYYFMAGVIYATAYELKKAGVITGNIRWGGDWNGNMDFYDQNFYDLGHFELK